MKKTLILFSLLFWFYGFRMVDREDNTIVISTVVGPFTNKLDCKKHSMKTQESLSDILDQIEFVSCQEIKKA